jgi:hypothetical protein
MYPEVNYLAILVCGLVSMVLGSIWYGPLFGKPWMAMIGIKKPDVMTPAIKKMMAKSYSIMFIGSLLMAFILGNILAYGGGGAGGVVGGLAAGFANWLGFIAPATIGIVLWESKPWKLWFINAGYFLVQMMVFGVILSLWK